MLRTVAFVLIFVLAGTLLACLWDSDTLATEEETAKDAISVLTGHFVRNPPKYYQMRLDRVSKELAKDPKNLNLYDDAGVACDRLGNSDEAIRWMERKRAVLPVKTDETSEDWYRYHANLGTFQAHKWIKIKDDRANLPLLDSAIKNIERAIEINPKAHFGREASQLEILVWLRNVHSDGDQAKYAFQTAIPGEPVGLIGLISLGNAWESVDVFAAIAEQFNRSHKASVGDLARRRGLDLIDQNARSANPNLPTDGKELAKRLRLHETTLVGSLHANNELNYLRLRENADEWHKSRTAYMMERLNRGEHPDTHPSFWNEYQPIPMAKVIDANHGEKFNSNLELKLFLTVIGVPSMVIAMIVGIILFRRHRMA